MALQKVEKFLHYKTDVKNQNDNFHKFIVAEIIDNNKVFLLLGSKHSVLNLNNSLQFYSTKNKWHK